MESKKLWIVLGITAVAIIGIIVWAIVETRAEQKRASTPDASTIYFYGEGCPHCKRINEFLDTNDVASKFDFTKKEVWSNRINSQQMKEKAEACSLDPSKTGVPFVYTEGNRCIVGEPEVKKFFAEKAGVALEESEK